MFANLFVLKVLKQWKLRKNVLKFIECDNIYCFLIVCVCFSIDLLIFGSGPPPGLIHGGSNPAGRYPNPFPNSVGKPNLYLT